MQLTFTNDEIVATLNCDHYKDNFVDLYLALKNLHRPAFEPNQKIVITSTFDYYKFSHGLILQSLQTIVNHVDISNCFILFVTTNKNIEQEYQYVQETFSTDSTSFAIKIIEGDFNRFPAGNMKVYSKINSIDYYKDDISQLTDVQKELLFENKTFCMIPWTSLFVHTNSKVAPCCAWDGEAIGDASKDSLETIWNSKSYQDLRNKMLNNQYSDGCGTCTRKDKLGKNTFR